MMTTEAHLDKLYALVREQSEQIDDLLLAKDKLEERIDNLEGTIGFMRAEIGNLESRCVDLEDRLS